MKESRFVALVERIEHESAVMELQNTRKQFLLPVSLLPQDIREGIVLEFTVIPRDDLTLERKNRISELQKKLSDKSRQAST